MEPTVDDLLKYTDNKYTLVAIAAKRARQLMEGAQPVVQTTAKKPVSIALEELRAGKLRYERTKHGIK